MTQEQANSGEKNIIERIIRPETGRGRMWQVFVLIILISFAAALIDFGKYYNKGVDVISKKTNNVIQLPHTKEVDYRLGLDLQGGTHLVYKADVSNVPPRQRESSIGGVRDVIERRVNVFGVSEPEVRTVKTADNEYRVIADLAGIKDVGRAIEMIGETPLLEFKEFKEGTSEMSEEKKREMKEFNRQAEDTAEEVLGKALSGGDFNFLVQEYDEGDNKDERWISRGNSSPALFSKVEAMDKGSVHNDLIETGEGFIIVKLLDEREKMNSFTDEAVKEIKASHILICYEGSENCDSDMSKEEAYDKIKDIKAEATPDNFPLLAAKHSTEPKASATRGELGWFGRGDMLKPFEDAVFPQEAGTISYVVETKFGYHVIYKEDERVAKEYKINDILIKTKDESDYTTKEADWENTKLTGKYLDSAALQWNQTGMPQIGLRFNDEGAELFEEITERNVGNKVGIFLDGEVISAPNVNEKIVGGEAVIEGKFTVDEAKKLVQRLNEGALPVPIKLIGQNTVGPTLGEKSINESMEAGLWGLLLIALFMILYYRLSGVIAVISLIIYGMIVMALFKILSVTLTLAGLAGFILSIGMAVDANVLIFERFKEELRAKKEQGVALREGFRRAWPSIRDGNISTLITAFILMQFSTTLVRGFAITLGIGILVSLFTAMVVTKNLMYLIYNKE